MTRGGGHIPGRFRAGTDGGAFLTQSRNSRPGIPGPRAADRPANTGHWASSGHPSPLRMVDQLGRFLHLARHGMRAVATVCARFPACVDLLWLGPQWLAFAPTGGLLP